MRLVGDAVSKLLYTYMYMSVAFEHIPSVKVKAKKVNKSRARSLLEFTVLEL